MNILINFSTLKAGGGQNVAMNFLYEIFKINDLKHNLFYFVAENSLPHKFLEEKDYEYYYIVSSNPIKRIFFEMFQSKKILEKWNIDIIYSYFGYGLFPKKYIQVSGVAVSNIFFPEIDFWDGYPFYKKIAKKIIDKFRIYGVKKANGLIFENKAMEERCKKFGWNINTIFIKPSIIDYNELYIDKKKITWEFINQPSYRGLFLCSWHLNKNLLIIPKIASILKANGIDYKFIITAGHRKNNFIYKKFISLMQDYDVKNYIDIIEPVDKSQLKYLYNAIDHVFLLSALESFSNNIVESWYFEKPLIITNALWAKSICKKAALYVNRNDENDIVNGILKLIKYKTLVNRLINEGKKELMKYPSIKEKTLQELNFLEDIYEKCKKRV
jgi:hypothetical protein